MSKFRCGSRMRAVLAVTTVLWLLAPALPAQSASDEVYYLGLGDALRMALDNNLDLVSARFAPEQAEQDITLQDAVFDTAFETSLQRSESDQPATQTSTITGSKSDQYQAGISKNTKYGADYTVGFQVNKNEQTGPNVVAPLSYFSGFRLTYNQPILKGFGTEPTTENLILAQNNLDISQNELEGQAETLLQTVEGAYWDVVAAREALRIARLALQRAQNLLEQNRKKVEVGTLAPIEITQAEAGVASQEEGVIVAEVQLEDAEDELRRLLAVPQSDPMWAMPIVNTDKPVFERTDVDLDAAIDTALTSRTEMHIARQVLKNSELTERVARRETRHQLDFNADYVPQGSSLDTPFFTNPSPPPAVIEGNQANLGESISNIFNNEQFQWTATLVYRVPIGNRTAKANYAKAKLSREKSEVDLQNQEQTIRVEVRRAVRGVESGIKRVEAAQVNVVLQKKKLEAEQKKYDNGMSTSFEVLTFQNDLADAELSEVRARLDYLKALTALERSQGTLLESHGLSIR